VGIWDEECDIDPSSGGRPDWFIVGAVDMWGATGSPPTVSRGIREGTVSGMMKVGMAVVIFLVGRDPGSVPWLDIE